MRVVLTGGTGLLGQRIGLDLVRMLGEEIELTVVSRRSKVTVQTVLPYPADVVTELTEIDFSKVDAVIHLAGEPVAGARWTQKRKDAILQSREQGTRALVNQLANAKAQGRLNSKLRFISASAIGYYGDRGSVELNAGSDPGDGFLAEVVKAWETEVLKARELVESVVRVRLGIVLSEEGGALTEMLGPFSQGFGGRLGSGNQWMSWIHIADASRIFCELATGKLHAPVGVIEAVAPQPVQNSDFTSTLCAVLKVKQGPAVPSLALYLRFGEMAQILLASQRVNPDALMSAGYQFQFERLDRALSDLLRGCEGGSTVKVYRQWLQKPVQDVWRFFSSEKNLERITPEFLHFKLIGKSTPQIEKGTLIDYQLRLNGIPFSWTTEIIEWDENKRFVDIQKKGPYQLWWHEHQFEAIGSSTLMTDRVIYRLPLGVLGEAVAGWKVSGDVERIFDHRRVVTSAAFAGEAR